jgi:hypothetical protein
VRARRMFKECPHPDENQRMQLSRELGLEPRQIKFWFQNRRTQMKVCSLTAPCHCFTFSPSQSSLGGVVLVLCLVRARSCSR